MERHMPKSVKDLDLSIEQLCYIAKDKELDVIRGTGKRRRKQRFLEFWKRRHESQYDPHVARRRAVRVAIDFPSYDIIILLSTTSKRPWRRPIILLLGLQGSAKDLVLGPFHPERTPVMRWTGGSRETKR